MKKWTIWFDQVNQTKFEIEARIEESAILKAQREWKEAYSNPWPSHIEEETDEARL